MMVRLGFAIAAHLEPEILVVDEVLAVRDAAFQKKAFGSVMFSVSRGQLLKHIIYGLMNVYLKFEFDRKRRNRFDIPLLFLSC